MHTGTTITDLQATVDSISLPRCIVESLRKIAEPKPIARQWPSSIDSEMELVAAPWLVVINARQHLTNRELVPGDVDAFCDMGKIQDCLLSGKTAECLLCGEMEGLHHKNGVCRVQRNYGDCRLSDRFTSKPRPLTKVVSLEFRMNSSSQCTVAHLECGHERVLEYGAKPKEALCWVCK